MDDFSQRYLLCESNPQTDRDSSLSGIAWQPGPPIVREPLELKDCRDVVEYPLTDVLSAFLALPHVQSTKQRTELRWSLADRWINLQFVETAGRWGETRLECYCTFVDIVWMWLALRRSHRAVLLRNAGGRLYTPRSFMKEIALPRLGAAFDDPDPTTIARAEQEMKVYRLVGRDALRSVN